MFMKTLFQLICVLNKYSFLAWPKSKYHQFNFIPRPFIKHTFNYFLYNICYNSLIALYDPYSMASLSV